MPDKTTFSVSTPPHEHQFSLHTENWEYAQRTITLRICSSCGLTHVLAFRKSDETFYWKLETFYWKRVEEEGRGL